MKIEQIFTAAAVIVMCLLGTIAQAQNVLLSGTLTGLKDKTIVIAYDLKGVNTLDTVKVANGKFVWKKNLPDPQQAYLVLPNAYYPFFVQPGKINISGIKDSVATYKVTGSSMQDESEKYSASVKDISEQENKIYESFDKVGKDEQLALEEKLEELKKQRTAISDRYISANPKSFYSMYLVGQRASYGSDYSEVKPLFDRLDASLKSTAAGITLAQRMTVLEKSKIGGDMMDFTQADTTGKPVKFSSFKGKYVLVDFWASWCGPCRAENPNVLKAYDTFKDKGFTVVGVSLDEKPENWKKAIRDDKMPWTQLSDGKGWKNEVSTYFGIQGIPSNLLVDPNGKIVAKDLRGGMLEKKLKELMN